MTLYCNAIADEIFVAQLEHMDCGHACIRMVCKWARHFDPSITYTGTPLWTVDLYLELLERSPCKVSFYTTSIGVASHHETIDWYQRNQTDGDELRRVSERFSECMDKNGDSNCQLFEKKFITYDIAEGIMQGNCVMVVLINAKVLDTSCIGSSGAIDGGSNSGSGSSFMDAYVGHYILIIGELCLLK